LLPLELTAKNGINLRLGEVIIRESVYKIRARLEEIKQHGVLLCPSIGAIQAFQIKKIYTKNRNKVKLRNTNMASL
jgi:hypothetical protein